MKFNISKKLKYGLLVLFSLPFLCLGLTYADDLLRDIMEPSINRGTTIDIGKNVKTVGKNVFEEGVQPVADDQGIGYRKVPSIIVKVTRLLLSLVVALSVTMILYNGLTYIIQTGQGKEGKDLLKNVVYIVIGILVSLLSITIITLLQSVSKTLDGSPVDWSRGTDNKVIYNERKGINRADIFNKTKNQENQ